VLGLDTVACFLALQEIRLDPKYTAKPPVDLLSSTQPAQTASEKALTNVDDDFLKVSPRFVVPLTYLSILFTAVQCTVVGTCRNWHTLLTEKDISGLVRV
jgi:hypothetical protein